MEDIELKFSFVILRIGRFNLSKKLNISYGKFIKIEKNISLLTISDIETINNLYNSLKNDK